MNSRRSFLQRLAKAALTAIAAPVIIKEALGAVLPIEPDESYCCVMEPTPETTLTSYTWTAVIPGPMVWIENISDEEAS